MRDGHDILFEYSFFRSMIIQELVNYAFADVMDYVDVHKDEDGNSRIVLKEFYPLNEYAAVVKQGNEFSIKFPNRMRALKALYAILSKEEAECRGIEREREVREMQLSVQMLVLSNKKGNQTQNHTNKNYIA